MYKYVCIIIVGCSRHVVRDVVFVIDTSSGIGFSRFQLVKELTENIIINLKINSPETLFGLITFDDFARFEFNISKYTDLDTLIPTINPGLSYYRGFNTNVSSALSLLSSGSVKGGFLQLRDKTLKVAIVITGGDLPRGFSSLLSTTNSLHLANTFDIYAIEIRYNRYNSYHTIFQLIATYHPSLHFSTRLITRSTTQLVEEYLIEQLCSSK